MEDKLLQRFAREFQPPDAEVAPDRILSFLDRSARGRFDREVFGELLERVRGRFGSVTPTGFARVYFEAWERLKRKSDHTMTDLNHIDFAARQARTEEMTRLEFQNLRLQGTSDISNFITVDVTRHCAVNFYNLRDEHDYLFVPASVLAKKEPLRVSLQNIGFHVVDYKELDIAAEIAKGATRVQFMDGSELGFNLFSAPVPRKEVLSFLAIRKNDLQEYQVHTMAKLSVLSETFPDIFGPAVERAVTPFAFKAAVALSAALLVIALFVHTTRCAFLEVFVGFSFLANVYVWRNFNVFLSIRLVGILAVSILIDIAWLVIKIMHFSQIIEPTHRAMRIVGFVLVGVMILVKAALVFFYNRVASDDHTYGFLGLIDEIGVKDGVDPSATI